MVVAELPNPTAGRDACPYTSNNISLKPPKSVMTPQPLFFESKQAALVGENLYIHIYIDIWGGRVDLRRRATEKQKTKL